MTVQNVLYLLVVNMPTEREMAEATVAIEKLKTA